MLKTSLAKPGGNLSGLSLARYNTLLTIPRLWNFVTAIENMRLRL